MADLQRAQQRRRRNTRVIPVILGVVILTVVLVIVTSNGSKHKNNVTTSSAAACPKIDGSSPRVIHFSKAPPNCLTKGKTYSATFVTNEGDIAVKFDTTKTPKTANNFIFLALHHYYDGTRIFRTDTSIGIIQGGSPHTESASDPGPGYTIPDEGSGYTYAPGDLVMARTSAPNSAGAQFFFCVTKACSNLNSQGNYVVFAHATSGLNVLQKILSMNVNQPGGLGGAPSSPVTIKSINVTES